MPETSVRLFRDASGAVPIADWLNRLEDSNPQAYAKCLAFILLLLQRGNELRRPHADMLRDGIYELRCKVKTVNYRILYFFMGANIACLSHAFTKERKVPSAEIDLALRRKRLVMSQPDKYTAEWET